MVNCAHPTHFLARARGGAVARPGVVSARADASHLSHVELDGAAALDRGDIDGSAADATLAAVSDLRVIRGYCGTDHEHVATIAGVLQSGPISCASLLLFRSIVIRDRDRSQRSRSHRKTT